MDGLIHVYYGDGKGKTTAALGLLLRAAGYGQRIVLVQFLKDAKSGELAALDRIPNVTVLRGKAPGAAFFRDMTDEQKAETRRIHDGNIQKAAELAKAGECDLLILDEALDAYQLGLLSEDILRSLLDGKPAQLELVITGHTPTGWISEKADYVTQMVKIKHPYDRGITARRGVEF